jgi:hypothetical protein
MNLSNRRLSVPNSGEIYYLAMYPEFTYNTLTITIPIPENYPETMLVKALKDHSALGNNLGKLVLTFSEDDISLDSFYIAPVAINPKLSTRDEKDALKGVGRIMLKYGIDLLIARELIDNDFDEVYFHLDAVGGECFNDKDIIDGVVGNLSREEILNNLSEIVEAQFIKVYSRYTVNDLRLLYCKILQNKQLANFYAHNLGLNIDNNRGLLISMSGSLSTVIDFLKDVYY